jgi:transposase
LSPYLNWNLHRWIVLPALVASPCQRSREHRRAKTDRLDTGLLMRAVLGWLRGEPKHCSMAAIPTIAEEDARRPNREHQTLVQERTRIVNRMKATLIRFGIRTFNVKLRKASDRLAVMERPMKRNDLSRSLVRRASSITLIWSRMSCSRAISRRNSAPVFGRDGFWLARWLRARGIEAYVIHPTSIPVAWSRFRLVRRSGRRSAPRPVDRAACARGLRGPACRPFRRMIMRPPQHGHASPTRTRPPSTTDADDLGQH